jgi:cbb3-type cytochrome oxidase subunit 3
MTFFGQVCMQGEIFMEKQSVESIQIDPTVLQEKGDTYSSLTDTNGIPLFTDKYEDIVDYVQAQKKAEDRNLQTIIFLNSHMTEKNEYAAIQNQLFMSTESQVKKKEVTDNKTDMGHIVALGGIVLIIFFMVVFSAFEKRRKRRREDAVNNYIYE